MIKEWLEMKFNRKGFTLIELLAVVVILLTISVIAVSSITAAIERNKKKQDDMKKTVIVGYAKIYYSDHRNSYRDVTSGCILLGQLDLTENESTDSNGDKFIGGVRFKNSGLTFEYDDSCQ